MCFTAVLEARCLIPCRSVCTRDRRLFAFLPKRKHGIISVSVLLEFGMRERERERQRDRETERDRERTLVRTIQLYKLLLWFKVPGKCTVCRGYSS